MGPNNWNPSVELPLFTKGEQLFFFTVREGLRWTRHELVNGNVRLLRTPLLDVFVGGVVKKNAVVIYVLVI